MPNVWREREDYYSFICELPICKRSVVSIRMGCGGVVARLCFMAPIWLEDLHKVVHGQMEDNVDVGYMERDESL